jgi:hypothetical protein
MGVISPMWLILGDIKFVNMFFISLLLLTQLGEEGKGNRQASPTPTHEPHTGDQVHTCQQN